MTSNTMSPVKASLKLLNAHAPADDIILSQFLRLEQVFADKHLRAQKCLKQEAENF